MKGQVRRQSAGPSSRCKPAKVRSVVSLPGRLGVEEPRLAVTVPDPDASRTGERLLHRGPAPGRLVLIPPKSKRKDGVQRADQATVPDEMSGAVA